MTELKLLASTDPMTKLYNRRYFAMISEHSVDLAKRLKQYVSMIILDIDDFKKINDTYGHQVGDKAIISLANILISSKRKSDIICRYGGEEFVLMLPNTSLDGAKVVAEKIRKDTQSMYVEHGQNQLLSFTISLGVSVVDVQNNNAIQLAIKEADKALYKAKNSGKNKVCY
jgi:diguanylate cyclase (GGDEF)-like protein